MKASDFLVDFLIKKGIDTAFVFTGGAIAHVIDSVAQRPKEMKYVCVQNEQVAAMAAEGAARRKEIAARLAGRARWKH